MTHPARFGAICRCAPCRAERAAIWSGLSPNMQNLMHGLAYGPRMWRDLSANQRVHAATIRAGLKAKLIQLQDMRVGPLIGAPLRTFLALTKEGEAILHTAPPQRRAA